MDILIWLVRGIHLISMGMLLGGAAFSATVGFSRSVNGTETETSPEAEKLLSALNHSVAGLLLVSGIVLVLNNPGFKLDLDNRWSALLFFKVMIYAMIIFSLSSISRMFRYLAAPSSNGGFDAQVGIYRSRIFKIRKLNLVLLIIAVIIAAAMHIYG